MKSKAVNPWTKASELIEVSLLALAHRAGKIILEIYESYLINARQVAIENKADNTPLTIADIASHKVIAETLQKLTPNWAVVSEEDVYSLVHRNAHSTFWLVDPLDGTKEFLSKSGEFTVNIALIHNGLVIWGVVYAPALNLMYWGGNHLGAFKLHDGTLTPIRVSNLSTRVGPLRVVASKNHFSKETADFLEKLGGIDLIQAGSSLKLCQIADGSADLYPRFDLTYEWDTAAAQAVVEGAGGYVYDLDGKNLIYGKQEMLNPYFIVAPEKVFI